MYEVSGEGKEIEVGLGLVRVFSCGDGSPPLFGDVLPPLTAFLRSSFNAPLTTGCFTMFMLPFLFPPSFTFMDE